MKRQNMSAEVWNNGNNLAKKLFGWHEILEGFWKFFSVLRIFLQTRFHKNKYRMQKTGTKKFDDLQNLIIIRANLRGNRKS